MFRGVGLPVMAALKCVMKSDCGVIRFVPDVIRIMDEPKSKLKKFYDFVSWGWGFCVGILIHHIPAPGVWIVAPDGLLDCVRHP